MPYFCRCGADEYICQVCAKIFCGGHAAGGSDTCPRYRDAVWVPGTGNVCRLCQRDRRASCDVCGTTEDLAELVAETPNDVGQYESQWLCREHDPRAYRVARGPLRKWCVNPRLCAGRSYCPRDPTCAD